MIVSSKGKRNNKKQEDTNVLVQWFDSILPSKTIANLAYKNVVYYNKCLCGALTLYAGDYILVKNADTTEPDTVNGCDVARILYLFELRENINSDETCRAVIQWYSRPEDLSQRFFDTDEITVDFDYEVIEDHRYHESDIALKSIYKKCKVIYGHTKYTARDILAIKNNNNNNNTNDNKAIKKNNPMFVCRYKLIRDSTRTYQLVPVQTDEHHAKANEKDKEEQKEEEEDEDDDDENKKITAFEKNHKHAKKTATNAVEFLDMAYFSNQHKVSPIRIVGGRSVVRVSSISKENTPTTRITKVNATITPKSHQSSAVCRNLNLTLEDASPGTINFLNYSIVKPSDGNVENEPSSDMKLKLRISKRHASKSKNLADNLKKCEIEKPMEKTPSPPRTRRKSILRSATTRNAEGTPKRSIQLSNIVEKCVFSKDDIISTPKRSRRSEYPINTTNQQNTPATRTRRRTIVCVVDDNDNDDDYTPVKRTPAKKNTPSTRKTPSKKNTPSKAATTTTTTTPIKKTPIKCQTPSQKLRALRSGEICPSLESRTPTSKAHRRKSHLQLACEQLHVGSVPKSLPCREKEFDNIYNFLCGKIKDECGGCMYVSGVPGTGKTATVTSVISVLQHEMKSRKLPPFEFLAINGMRLTEPRQAYVHIYRQLTGKMMPWEQAYTLLDKRFNTTSEKRITTILLVDELDILCNRRQDVVYNLLDWPTKTQAHLVVITIANTMDLPERLLRGKVNSRLGLTRLTFQPYTHKQLQEIVTSRLAGSSSFKNEAIQLVARKVAAVSGDARRALDICRRATEMADSEFSNEINKTAQQQQQQVNMQHVQMALNEMIASAKVQAIKSCSNMEQLFLQAMVAESTRTGVEETTFMSVYTQVETLASLKGLKTPIVGQMLRICSQLGSRRLIICEHSRNDIFQKLLLNVSMDDIYYALQVQHDVE